MFLRTTLAVSILVLALAYMMRPRFPDTASNHGIKTFMWAYMKLIDLSANTGHLIGVSRIKVIRTFFNALLLMDQKSDAVQEYVTTLDGVEVTIFKPAGEVEGLRPGIVHYHGGGWVLLSPAHYGPVCRSLVEHTQSIVVSVNYRKAPEHPFPVPIEDCLKATRYILKNAEQFGIDRNRIGVKGDSAGGNLAMAAALQLAKESDPDLPSLKFMSLDYPALQAFDFYLPSYLQHGTGPGFLQKHVMVKYWMAYALGHLDYFDDFMANNHTTIEMKQSIHAEYLSWDLLPVEFTKGYVEERKKQSTENKELAEKIKSVILNPLFAPLMASDDDLGLLPATYIMNAEFDVLRDDGFLAAERLRMVGVDVEHSYLPAEEHGFLNLVLIDQNVVNEFVNFAQWFKQIMQ